MSGAWESPSSPQSHLDPHIGRLKPAPQKLISTNETVLRLRAMDAENPACQGVQGLPFLWEED